MSRLEHRINFVIPERFFDDANSLGWPEIPSGNINAITDEVLTQRCVGSMNNWVVIPYIYFRRAGYDVSHSPEPLDDAINIVSSVDFGIRHRPVRPFIVACRADCHEPKLANWVFEQNNLNKGKAKISWTPHFPQPGLIARKRERGAELSVLGYMGETSNLYEQFCDETFLSALNSMGVIFRHGKRSPEGDEPVSMHDYSNVDAIIAIRNLTLADVANKPASKLVNAWAAGVPALLGAEPAYQELRKSSLDYIEINSSEDAINAIRRLKDDANLYNNMISNGQARAKEFTVSEILCRWVEHLNGPVGHEFVKWQRKNGAVKSLLWLKNAAADKIARKVYLHRRDTGERPFE
ncbi:MAG: glycosyltransferase family 1 protein [Marinicaulis sp.]|nr:glycosyltransferase family 1 protein [Marinicaulis sp.]